MGHNGLWWGLTTPWKDQFKTARKVKKGNDLAVSILASEGLASEGD